MTEHAELFYLSFSTGAQAGLVLRAAHGFFSGRSRIRAGEKLLLFGALSAVVLSLSFNTINFLTSIVYPQIMLFIELRHGFLLSAAADASALGLAALLYRSAFRCLRKESCINRGNLFLTLLSFFALFLFFESVNRRFYGNTTVWNEEGIAPRPELFFAFVLQTVGILGFFGILYFYQSRSENLRLRRELDAALRENSYREKYCKEAASRYERTRALRHDMRAHLLVIGGLLRERKYERATVYTAELTQSVEELSFPYRTGNPVVDILLSEKLFRARENGIIAECASVWPELYGVSDADLCVLFSNALDNAITACGKQAEGEPRYIRLSVSRQGRMLCICIRNSQSCHGPIREGVGIANMRRAVEKYDGTLSCRSEGGEFVLTVLLHIF